MVKSWDNASYPYRREVALDAPTANVADFPFLLKLEDTDALPNASMASKRYQVYDHNGTLLSYEEESYTEGASYVNFETWCKVPNIYLSPTGDQNKVWVYYGYDPGSDQDNAANAWDANFGAVWNTPNGSVLSAVDSTANNNDGTINTATAAAGIVNGGIHFDSGDAVPGVTIPDNTTLNFGTGDFSIEAWVNLTWANNGGIFRKYTSYNNDPGYGWFVNDGYGAGKFWFYAKGTNTVETAILHAGLNDGVWHQIVAVADRVGNTVTLYVDGAQDRQVAGVTGSVSNAVNLLIGQGYISYAWTATADNLRLSNTARSAAWIAYEYANIANADNEQMWGNEESAPSAGGPFPHYTRRRMVGGMITMGVA